MKSHMGFSENRLRSLSLRATLQRGLHDDLYPCRLPLAVRVTCKPSLKQEVAGNSMRVHGVHLAAINYRAAIGAGAGLNGDPGLPATALHGLNQGRSGDT